MFNSIVDRDGSIDRAVGINDKSLYVPVQLIYSKSINQAGTSPTSANVLEIDRKRTSLTAVKTTNRSYLIYIG